MTSSKALTRTYFIFWVAFLLFTAALPGTLCAQGSDEVRSVQNIFAPVGPPAEILKQTAVLVLLICLGIFVVVGGFLFYAVVRYRRRSPDENRTDPPRLSRLSGTAVPPLSLRGLSPRS